jgi:hypothetical protein
VRRIFRSCANIKGVFRWLGSQGSLGIFFSNGLVGTIMALGFVALFWPATPTA